MQKNILILKIWSYVWHVILITINHDIHEERLFILQIFLRIGFNDLITLIFLQGNGWSNDTKLLHISNCKKYALPYLITIL